MRIFLTPKTNNRQTIQLQGLLLVNWIKPQKYSWFDFITIRIYLQSGTFSIVCIDSHIISDDIDDKLIWKKYHNNQFKCSFLCVRSLNTIKTLLCAHNIKRFRFIAIARTTNGFVIIWFRLYSIKNDICSESNKLQQNCFACKNDE